MSGSVRVCEAGAIDHVVTDAALPPAARAAIDEAGIEVTIA
jgi:DeoR/GlpR family transcriptional regulator of sugar metabolism